MSDPLEDFVDKMIAAPLDEHGNYSRLEDATLAAHELTSVFSAFLDSPSIFMGVPIGALIPPEDLLVLQLMLAAIHSQACTPERKAEAEKYAREAGLGDVVSEIKKALGASSDIAPQLEPLKETGVEEAGAKSALPPWLENFLKGLEGPGPQENTTEGE